MTTRPSARHRIGQIRLIRPLLGVAAIAPVVALASVVGPAAPAAALLAGATLASDVPSAAAGGASGCQTVHVGPETAGRPSASGYFQLTSSPGAQTPLELLVANPQPYPCSVVLVPAWGHTAVNSGDTYPPLAPGQACTGVSCWISGLPHSVLVPPAGRVDVAFDVRLPAGLGPGEYLAGVLAEPGSAPGRTGTTAPGSARTVGADVVARVAIGVAVTVPGPLSPLLRITAVAIDDRGPQGLADVAVTIHNDGNTWEKGPGVVSVDTSGGSRSASLLANTILPHEAATVHTTVAGVAGGTHAVRVELFYDGHTRVATWKSDLAFPAPPRAVARPGGVTVLVAPGSHRQSTPVLIALVALSATVALLAGFLLAGARRRRQDSRGSAPPGTPGPPPPGASVPPRDQSRPARPSVIAAPAVTARAAEPPLWRLIFSLVVVVLVGRRADQRGAHRGPGTSRSGRGRPAPRLITRRAARAR